MRVAGHRVKSKQLSFLDHRAFRGIPKNSEHGGGIRKGQRKAVRPVDTRRPMHVTLRSNRAQGAYSMLRPKSERVIKTQSYRLAKKFGVRIYQYANSGNHLHFLIQTRSRKGFQNFLRSLAGIIARIATGATKAKVIGRFWDELAYSRFVNWGRDFFAVRDYIIMNEMEGQGGWSRSFKSTVCSRGDPGRSSWKENA